MYRAAGHGGVKFLQTEAEAEAFRKSGWAVTPVAEALPKKPPRYTATSVEEHKEEPNDVES